MTSIMCSSVFHPFPTRRHTRTHTHAYTQIAYETKWNVIRFLPWKYIIIQKELKIWYNIWISSINRETGKWKQKSAKQWNCEWSKLFNLLLYAFEYTYISKKYFNKTPEKKKKKKWILYWIFSFYYIYIF